MRVRLLFGIVIGILSTTLAGQESPDSLTTIAVVDLQGHAIEDNGARLLSDRLRVELFRLGTFSIVEREMMNEILREQGLQQSGCTSEACMVEAGRLLGVRQIVGGSISRFRSTLSITARRVDVATGAILAVAAYDHRGPLEALLDSGMPLIARQLAGEADASGNTAPAPRIAPPQDHRYSFMQIAVIAPVQIIPAKYSIYGLAVNGVYGRNRDVFGISAGAVNHARGTAAGISAGAVNVAGHCIGLQAGLINVADRLSGVQIGLINVVRDRKRVPLVPILNIGF